MKHLIPEARQKIKATAQIRKYYNQGKTIEEISILTGRTTKYCRTTIRKYLALTENPKPQTLKVTETQTHKFRLEIEISVRILPD